MLTCSGKSICGLYESYEDFLDAMFDCEKFRAANGLGSIQGPFSNGTKFTLVNFRHSLRAVAEEDKRPTLIHLDLKLGNMC